LGSGLPQPDVTETRRLYWSRGTFTGLQRAWPGLQRPYVDGSSDPHARALV